MKAKVLAAVMSMLFSAAAAAVIVHTWVDADGVRHFADAPPADNQASSEVKIDDAPPGVDVDTDYYSIVNQWQRLRAEREAQAALDLERERVDAEQRASATPPATEPPRAMDYPHYYGYPLPPYGLPTPLPSGDNGPPSPRNAHVNTAPPVWPRER